MGLKSLPRVIETVLNSYSSPNSSGKQRIPESMRNLTIEFVICSHLIII